MKVTYNWLKDFVDIKLAPEELAHKLTMAGLSVALLESIDDDWVYDLEITSNRPDCLSVIGIAREVAAITNSKLASWPVGQLAGTRKKITKKENRQTGSPVNRLTIHIEDKKDCPLYSAVLIQGVKVGSSPEWMRKRLEAVGVRCVNNIVDITNYCLFEYGQPLHAFDWDKMVSRLALSEVEGSADGPVSGLEINVRKAKAGEELGTIDGIKRILNENVLVIAAGGDSKTGQPANRPTGKPIAIAGVMGGRETEVSSSTQNCLLESAYFSPLTVRRSSRGLGLGTQASYRFERGVDFSTVRVALQSAAAMICELSAGSLVSAVACGSPPKKGPLTITCRLSDMTEVLSLDLSFPDVQSILKRLGFIVRRPAGGVFEVLVPEWRRDIRIGQDVTEELARIYGYDKIPLTTPALKACRIQPSAVQTLSSVLKRLLVCLGFKEVITYSLLSCDDYQKSGLKIPQELFSLESPLSRDYCFLRSTLLPSLLGCLASNASHGNHDLEIFEIARVFEAFAEKTSLGLALCGVQRAGWPKEAKSYTILDLKGVIETFLEELGVRSLDFKSVPAGPDTPWVFACQVASGGRPLGLFGQVSEAVKKTWGIKHKKDIFAAELSLEALAPAFSLKKAFAGLPATPSISRDISLLVPAGVSYAKIKEFIEARAGNNLRALRLADCYRGRQTPQDKSGLTIALEYGCPSKTLTEAEINPVHQNLLEGLQKELGLVIR